jgi:hypothetical protein
VEHNSEANLMEYAQKLGVDMSATSEVLKEMKIIQKETFRRTNKVLSSSESVDSGVWNQKHCLF